MGKLDINEGPAGTRIRVREGEKDLDENCTRVGRNQHSDSLRLDNKLTLSLSLSNTFTFSI